LLACPRWCAEYVFANDDPPLVSGFGHCPSLVVGRDAP
jgi:hypothetical protein